jgi:ribosomal protein S18 acetylase RimI-like enzyme
MLDQLRLAHLSGLQSEAFINSDSTSWVRDASNPYWDWLWGSASEALAQLKAWLERPSSEISVNRILCIADSHDILGGFIALSGRELQQCRRADFLVLLNYARRNHCEELMAKIRKANQLFSTVLEDEYYLSRIGVQPCARGKGLGKELMKAYLDNGTAKGFQRFRLDVDASNVQAIHLYEASGFTTGSIAKALDVPFRYCSMTATFKGGPRV